MKKSLGYMNVLCGLVLLIGFGGGCFGQQSQSNPTLETSSDRVIRFLQRYLSDPKLGSDKTTRVSSASFKITDSKTETVVYVLGQRWCGSGGCTLLVLEPNGDGFRVIGQTSVVQLPIRVLSSKTKGLPDLSVRVQGGGIQQGYDALLAYNGERYPSNPSVPPAQRLTKHEQGEILISTAETSRSLYQ